MNRREELRMKYSAKVEELDAQIEAMGKQYDALCKEGKEDTPEGEQLYHDINAAMGEVNHYLRIMGRADNGYDK